MSYPYPIPRSAQGGLPILILVAVLAISLWLPQAGCIGEKGRPESTAGGTAPAPGTVQAARAATGARAPTGESVGREAAPEAAEVSDLDQSTETLLSKECEHGIPQYTCDECRYEVGMVKVSTDLFAPGGLLSTARAMARPAGAGRVLNGEVALDAEKAVQITPRVPGIVRSVLVDVGSPIAPGQVLLVLDSPDVAEARSV
jgi:membrane fusion protein, heavy metal efflux system